MAKGQKQTKPKAKLKNQSQTEISDSESESFIIQNAQQTLSQVFKKGKQLDNKMESESELSHDDSQEESKNQNKDQDEEKQIKKAKKRSEKVSSQNIENPESSEYIHGALFIPGNTLQVTCIHFWETYKQKNPQNSKAQFFSTLKDKQQIRIRNYTRHEGDNEAHKN